MLLLLLNYWADLGLFLASVIGLSFALKAWLQRQGGGISRAGWVAIGCSLVVSAFCVKFADSQQRSILRERLEGFAPTYAQEMELMGHEDIGPGTPPDSPAYLRMIAAEVRWLKANPNVSDIYTYRRLPDGQTALIVDSETDYNHDGQITGDRESRTKIGEIYRTKMPAFLAALGGQAGFDEQPQYDRWGTWVSACVPIRNRQGLVEAALGVDFDATAWNIAIALSRLGAIGVSAAICSIVLGSIAVVSLTRADSNRSLAMQRQMLIASREAALHDGLTGLPNRLMFSERLDQALKRSKVDPAFLFAVLFVDCDNFKTVNDTLGHNAGDMLLRQIGQRIQSVVRGVDDVAARVGGDEFAILLSGLRTPKDALQIATRLLASAATPYLIAGQQVSSGMSVGVTTSASDYQTTEQMVHDADGAMYRAKRSGRNRFVVAHETLSVAA